MPLAGALTGDWCFALGQKKPRITPGLYMVAVNGLVAPPVRLELTT